MAIKKSEETKKTTRMHSNKEYEVKVTHFTDCREKEKTHEKLLAFADVCVDDCFTIKGLSLWKNDADEMYLGYPSEKYTNKEGKSAYSKKVYFNDEVLEDTVALAIWNAISK